MFQNSRVRGQPQSQADEIYRQMCSLLYRILECPPMESISGPLCRDRIGRSHMTPVGFAFLLFGIASSLMLIGSTAFMIGIMMMPLVATVAMVFSFIGIFANLATPVMWPWSQGVRTNKNNRKEDCI